MDLADTSPGEIGLLLSLAAVDSSACEASLCRRFIGMGQLPDMFHTTHVPRDSINSYPSLAVDSSACKASLRRRFVGKGQLPDMFHTTHVMLDMIPSSANMIS